MFDSPIFEAAIGLVFVYLLFSLVVSALNEAILGHLVHLRALVLEDSLKALLSGNGNKTSPLWRVFASKSNATEDQSAKSEPANFADQLLAHPLITGLASGRKNCPGYLPAGTFADAVIGVLAGPGVPQLAADGKPEAVKPANPPTTPEALTAAVDLFKQKDDYAFKVLSSVLAGAKDFAEARQQLETWFDDSMARVSGAYKRHTQLWLYVWSALLVVWLNLDTLELAKRLMNDSQFRAVLVANATQFVNQARTNPVPASATTPNTNTLSVSVGTTTNRAMAPGPASSSDTNQPTIPAISNEQLQKQIADLRLPLGWASFTNQAADSCIGLLFDCLPVLRMGTSTSTNTAALVNGMFSSPAPNPVTPQQWLLKLFGLLITIGAISQGAPFWFDLLNKLTNLRASGPPPKVAEKPTQPART